MRISVRVKIRSRENRVELVNDTYVVYVKAPAIENRANQSLREVLSDYFHVPKSAISIISGLKSRNKIVKIGVSQKLDRGKVSQPDRTSR